MNADTIIAVFTSHQDVILHYRYLILCVILVVEGTATMLTAGALTAAGYFQPVPVMLVCTLAEIIDGFVWYSVGYFFGAKPIDYFIRNSPARRAFMDAIRRHSDRNAGLIVLLVKMTYSVTNATLVLIGSLKYNVRRFAVFNAIGSVGWAGLLLSLGYTFGYAALAYLPFLRHIGALIAFIIVSAAALFILKQVGDFLIQRVRRST